MEILCQLPYPVENGISAKLSLPGYREDKWARQGSNLRPIGYEPTALPLSYEPLKPETESKFHFTLLGVIWSTPPACQSQGDVLKFYSGGRRCPIVGSRRGKRHRVMTLRLETLRQKNYRKQSLWRDLPARSPKG